MSKVGRKVAITFIEPVNRDREEANSWNNDGETFACANISRNVLFIPPFLECLFAQIIFI